METTTDCSGPKTASASAEESACVGAGTRGQSMDYATYPKIEPADVHHPPPPPSSSSPKSVSWSSDLVREAPPPPPTAWDAAEREGTSIPTEGNPYVNPAPVSSKNTMESVKEVLGKWGKKLGETAKKTEDLAGNFWQHLKTGPSFADAALGRVAQGTKVIAEGGYEKIFQQTFDSFPEEELKKSYACYLSTSAGPVMGTLYLSTAKLAFCSDNPLSYTIADKTEWSYYKVVIPLRQLRSINPSTSQANPAEKYIQIVSVDNHEFWFMGFLSYDSAVKNLQEALNDSGYRVKPAQILLPNSGFEDPSGKKTGFVFFLLRSTMANPYYGSGPLRSREGLTARSSTGTDEIQLRIDPMHDDLDEQITGLHSKIRQLKGVAQEIDSEAKFQNDFISQLQMTLIKVQAGVKNNIRRMDKKIFKQGSNHVVHVILFVLFCFLVVYLLSKFSRR